MTTTRRQGRKAMDKLNGHDSREAMWKVIRKLRIFSVTQIYMETTLNISSVREYLTGLSKGGFIKKMSGGGYELIKDVGVDAPRVRKDGTTVTQGQGRINMWRTMRILKRFSARELAIAATTESCEVKESSARDYIRHLHLAGYLRHLAEGKYLFLDVRYTGPKPPMIQRVKRVFDQNLKKVMWSEDGGRQ